MVQRTPFPLFPPSLISITVSMDVKHHVYLLTKLMLWKTALHAAIPEKLEFKQEVVQRPVIRRRELC